MAYPRLFVRAGAVTGFGLLTLVGTVLGFPGIAAAVGGSPSVTATAPTDANATAPTDANATAPTDANANTSTDANANASTDANAFADASDAEATPVTPVAPSVTQSQCISPIDGASPPTYTIPDVTGVDYYDGSTLLQAGHTYDATPGTTLVITATAQPGYVLAPGAPDAFTLVFQPAPDCTLTAKAPPPQLTPPGCAGPNNATPATLTIPDVPGVDYWVDGVLAAPGTQLVSPGEHTVVAKPQPGYRLQGRTTFVLTVPVAECAATVAPQAPTVTQSACLANGKLTYPTYTIPDLTGVSYAVAGDVLPPGTYRASPSGTITVVATPVQGYEFADAAPQVAYRLSFDEEPTCVLAAHHRRHTHGGAGGTHRHSSGGVAQASTLPATGADTTGVLLAAGVSVAVGAGMLRAGRRRTLAGAAE